VHSQVVATRVTQLMCLRVLSAFRVQNPLAGGVCENTFYRWRRAGAIVPVIVPPSPLHIRRRVNSWSARQRQYRGSGRQCGIDDARGPS